MKRKTYTDAEVWADPRSAGILEIVNASRKHLGLWLLIYGEPRLAAPVRMHLERDDANKRELERLAKRRKATP